MTANRPASTSSVNFGPKDQSDDSYPGKQPELADPFEFERRVVNAYRLLGYNVHRVRIVGGVSVDIVLERGVERTPVMLRTSTAKQIDELRRDAIRLKGLKANDLYSATPVIVVRQFASLATRNWAQHQTDVTIVSLADLESQAAKMQPAPDFEFAFFDKEMARSLAIAEQTQIRDELIGQLLRHDEDASAFSPSGFEALCMKVFAFLFDPNLFGFEAQSQTSDGANRYDFICRIAPGRPFWDTLRTDFRTRALLFECKNFTDPITADQIYSTERYLFSGALRTVCFLIARKGGDEGCMRAAQGAMRESGKLILVLSNRDLIKMLELVDLEGRDQSGPEGVLEERIWRFIISLPR
jgi:hypothetical protein